MKEIELKGLKESIYYEKVSGGLPVYVWKNEKVKGIFCALCVHYGSIDQEFKMEAEKKYHKVPSGIAHFIEHLNFYEPDGTTATDFYAKYGSEVNAFTTFDYTCYHVYTTKEVEANLNHLLDFVLTPSFNKKMVNKEKNIIIEELSMYEDLPDTQLFFQHYGNLFHKYKYSDMVTGTKESVKNTSIEDIEFVYQTFYHPENMFLIVTGNVNPYEIAKITEDNLKKKKIERYQKPKVKKPKEPISVVNCYKELEGNVTNSKVKVSMKTPLSSFKSMDPVVLRLILSLITTSNFGPTSDLKEELMEKELISYMGASRSIIGDYAIITVSAETKYPKEAVKAIKTQFSKLSMTEENLMRKIHSSVASLVLNYDDIMGVSDNIQEEILAFGTIIPNLKEHLENITIKQVEQVIKKLDTKNIAVTVLHPKEK